ncbi:centrosome-associated protein 350-like isoform X2 [Leptopilina heterotoma]|uniref:centrosome-associated protein 350-like isoform X2 n=1 Tax=Leptopilina heterotoma TaxID=63436 RepID=UPI001CA9C8CE|nr:centrosome-associated protein 350-like isoform X2 [Leptopilina heterotoma]
MKNCQCMDDHNYKKQHASNNSDDSAEKIKTSIISDVPKISENEAGWNKNLNKLSTENSVDSRDETVKGENFKTCLDYNLVKPYPFSFITAVKRKFALNEQSDICKKIRELEENKEKIISNEFNEITTKRQTNCPSKEKMDFIKPLKVPDLKISPKTIDYPTRESSSISEVSAVKKFNMISKDNVQKEVKLSKSSDRVQRKLDFSSSDTSILQNDGHDNDDDDNERINPSDVSVLSSLIKKKDHPRDNSRDKENRSKRIKKDDSSSTKTDSFSQDVSKRLKNTKCISKRDTPELVFKKIGTERFLCHTPKVSDFGLKKSRNKHFATSTLKKDEDKKYRCSNIQYSKSLKDKSLKLKGKFINSESINLSERSSRFQDRVSTKESYSDTFTESDDWKSRDENNLPISSRIEEEENKSIPDSRHSKQSRPSNYNHNRELEVISKEQIMRIPSKHKYSNSKIDSVYSLSTSDILEEAETASDSNISYSKHQTESEPCETFSQASKVKEIKISAKSDNSSLNNTTNEEMNTESQISVDTSLSERLLDPRRISFRDNSYSQQNEFSDLVTPDMNLMLRSKRRRQFPQSSHKESPHKNVKNKQTIVMETEEKNSQSLHPAVLKIKHQAEERQLNTIESMRQAAYESNLYNSSCEEGMQSEETVNNEIRKQLVALRSEANEEINKEEIRSINKALHNADNCFVNKITTKGSTVLKKSLEENLTKNLSDKIDSNYVDNNLKLIVKMAEVQTQTANDIATQTDINFYQSRMLKKLEELSGITYERGVVSARDIPEFSLESLDRDKDFGQLDDISLASRMKTMSEISLHETTSSIKTESGTEISISTRDVTCSFNKDLALEMAQLVQDEKQRYDKIQMLFKSHEKTLNDRTKKIVKLEEQKRQLRDTGQDSRISSIKKKQRALLLKLQQEKDEMNRLKELHKIASQERKLMLQKHKDMFNPEMSTKNILTKLKRSADCQSPRRLSGPMKGYDIRSNSSMSSLVDSDKSQLDRSQLDMKLKTCDTNFQKSNKQFLKVNVDGVTTEFHKWNSDNLETINVKNGETVSNICKPYIVKPVKNAKYDIKSRKFEEKMPGGDVLRQIELHSKLKRDYLCELPESSKESENLCSPKSSEKIPDSDTDSRKSKNISVDHDILKNRTQRINSDSDLNDRLKKGQTSAVVDEFLQINSKYSKKIEKDVSADKGTFKKIEHTPDGKPNSKRKVYKNQKTKVADDSLDNTLKSKSDLQICQELSGHHNKRSKLDTEQSDDNYHNSILEKFDFSESQNSLHALLKHSKEVNDKNYQLLRDITSDSEDRGNIETFDALDKRGEEANNFSQKDKVGNLSTRSQVSTLTISRHSSGDSEKSYSRSVVIRSHDHRIKTSKKLEQILNAREAALASRRSCVEEWIAWHTRLREEESRVARMEQAAYKLVNATSKALFYHDTSVSSEASDVEGRIDALAQKLADRRAEMAKLKKEAKRQAKQRLRAMEVSLLNQIKKYDATIHEMRKTLETKKESMKNCEKMPIESKSVSDFRVPKIPIKKIHDICKSSDLLPQPESEEDIQDKIAQSTKLLRNRLNDHEITKHSNFPISNELNQRTLEEIENLKSFNEDTNKSCQSRSEFNSSSRRSNQHLDHSKNHSHLQVTNSSESKNNSHNIVEKSTTKENQLSNTEKDKYLDSVAYSIENEIPTNSSENISLSFSKKLDSLGANGKNLNDDISVLESDLKTLSEMMLQISSKKSINKLTTLNQSENTCSQKQSFQEPNFELNKNLSVSLLTKTDVIDDADSINEVDDIISNDDKIDESFEDKLSKKIDFKAKSKEILNEIEKSIICDHMKTLEIQAHQTFEEGLDNLQKKSKILSSDLLSLEDDTKSISEILSETAESKSVSENTSAMYDNEISKFLKEHSNNSENKFIENNETLIFNKLQNTSENLENLPRSQCVKNNGNCQEIQEKSNTEEYTAILENSEENKLSEKSTKTTYESKVSSPEFSDVESCVDFIKEKDSPIFDSLEFSSPFRDEQIIPSREIEKSQSEEEIPNVEDQSKSVEKIESDSLLNFGDKLINVEKITSNSEKEVISEILNSNETVSTNGSNDLELNSEQNLEQSPNDETWFIEKNSDILSSTKKDEFSPSIPMKSNLSSNRILDTTQTAKSSLLTNIPLPEVEDDMGESIQKLFSPKISVTVEPQILQVNNILTNDFEIREYSESTEEQYSSEGEQLDNLVEIAEGKLETLEKSHENSSSKSENCENPMKTFTILEENLNISQTDENDLNDSQKSEDERYTLGKVNEIQSFIEQDDKDERIDDRQTCVDEYYVDEKHTSDDSSESSEEDTNKDTSEPIITSPRDKDDSRLEIDSLNDDLLSSISIHQNLESKGDYQVTPIVTNAEKEIMATIDKLKASLKQPGLEVSELDATLLRIEQLQIELEIKKLEAEEVSYYVREIPNKPPPPYTPPSSGKLSTSQSSPSPPPAVIPTNVDDLTVFIERATSIIFKAKEDGENIMSLEAPPEIWELRKDNDSLKKDRRIYNTFLFDLCKETIAEVFCVNDDKPGPSWTRPNVKTKTAIKVPKSLEELTDYVNKEVATLFGFKTKLQRENMVMRWSRKRRDRVDELLAREAQAEEEEWTKFHYDELAVKNELTVAILDSIILETVNVVKTAFTKKRKLKV